MIGQIDATLETARESADQCEWCRRYSLHVGYLRNRIVESGPPAQRVIEQNQVTIADLETRLGRWRMVGIAGLTTTLLLSLWILAGLPMP